MSTDNSLTEALEEVDIINEQAKTLDQTAPSLDEVQVSINLNQQTNSNVEDIAVLENDNLFKEPATESKKEEINLSEQNISSENTNIDNINKILNKEIVSQKESQKKKNLNSNPINDLIQNSHNILKLYSKCDAVTKKMIRDLIKLALMSNGIFLEKPLDCEDINFSQLNLSLRDGDILNLRLENLILTKESTQVTKEMILSAAKEAESVSQILQKLQKSPMNKNLRFKIENILANNQIILPP